MGSSWHARRRQDHYYRKAKSEGYLSRAAYKLKEILRKEGIVQRGSTVVDLGAAPGGWSQVAKEAVGDDGIVVAVDLKPIEAEGVIVVRGDMTQDATIERILEATGGPVETVISDMAPNISGNYSMDHARSVHLAEVALETAERILKPGGTFVVKVFQGDLFKGYYDRVGRVFQYSTAINPKATRKGSSEAYVIGKRFRGS